LHVLLLADVQRFAAVAGLRAHHTRRGEVARLAAVTVAAHVLRP
jgi:hypothetical protein